MEVGSQVEYISRVSRRASCSQSDKQMVKSLSEVCWWHIILQFAVDELITFHNCLSKPQLMIFEALVARE